MFDAGVPGHPLEAPRPPSTTYLPARSDAQSFQQAVDGAVMHAHTDGPLHAIVSRAQQQCDPLAALRVLNDGYADASPDVKDALLSDPSALKIIDAAVAWVDLPLRNADRATTPQAQTASAIQRLADATRHLDKSLAGAVANRAVPAYQQFHKPNQGNLPSLFGLTGMTTLVDLAGRISGSREGDNAVSRFAALDGWNGDAVRNAIAAGADPAYAIELARQLKQRSVDPSIVVQAMTDGIALRDQPKIASGSSPAAAIEVANRMQAAGLDGGGVLQAAADGVQQFKNKVVGDVKTLARHDAELAWLIRNDGAGMSPRQLSQAIADYRNAAWQAEDDRLGQQIARDGSALMNQLAELDQARPHLSGSRAEVDKALNIIANDPAAGLAISVAIQTDPQLAAAQQVKDVADVFALSKVGDIGRKYTNLLASVVLRRNVLAKLRGVNMQSPASVKQATQAIGSISNDKFARFVGVTKGDLDKAVRQVQSAANKIAAAETPQEIDAALLELDRKLNTDTELCKTFNRTTVPGQLLRGVAVAFAAASLINSSAKYNANPSDVQNGIKLLFDSAGFAQKNSELMVGFGLVGKDSAIGRFGGEWKLARRASAGDLIAGVSAVLDLISAARSQFGLGVPQDTGSAIFSTATAVGGGLTVAPAFGAAAEFGPIGLGVTLLAVIGKAIYDSNKDAHLYESASRKFLQAAGYDDAAANALSERDGISSGAAAGAAQMPFLAKYAQFKHLTPDQLENWINGLTPDQIHLLSECLLEAAGDCNGQPSQFTSGPAQTTYIHDDSGTFPTQITLTNTVGVFEDALNRDHVPHP